MVIGFEVFQCQYDRLQLPDVHFFQTLFNPDLFSHFSVFVSIALPVFE
jgi:hypothetical protein